MDNHKFISYSIFYCVIIFPYEEQRQKCLEFVALVNEILVLIGGHPDYVFQRDRNVKPYQHDLSENCMWLSQSSRKRAYERSGVYVEV